MKNADEYGEEPRCDAFISYARNKHENVSHPLFEGLTDRWLRTWLEVSIGADAEDLYEVISRGGTQEVAVSLAEGTMETSVDERSVKPSAGLLSELRTDGGSRKPRVFLSGSKADTLVVNQILDNIESHGIDVYFFVNHKQSRLTIPKKVKGEIDNSDLVIAVQTPYSKDSVWIDHEIMYAEGRDKPVIIVRSVGLEGRGLIGNDREIVKYVPGEEDRMVKDLIEQEDLINLLKRATEKPSEEMQKSEELVDQNDHKAVPEISENPLASSKGDIQRVIKSDSDEADAELLDAVIVEDDADVVSDEPHEVFTGTRTDEDGPSTVPGTLGSTLRERINQRVGRETSMGEFSQVFREEVTDAIREIQDEHVPGPVPDTFWEEVLGVYDQTMSKTSRDTIRRNFEEFRDEYRKIVLIESEPLPASETRSNHEVTVIRPWWSRNLYTDEAWRERVVTHDIPEEVQPHVVVVPGEFTDDWLRMMQYSALILGGSALAVNKELSSQRGMKPLWKLLGEFGEVPSGTLSRIGFVVSSNWRNVTLASQANVREYLGYLVLREAFETYETAS